MCSVAHGCALAFIPHLFSSRYREMIIPSTHDYGSLIPWGSHPLTDQLLSATHLRVVHDGAGFGRVEKTKLVASYQEFLDTMHVCWLDLELGNCSRCEKCIRTMLTLDLLGLKEKTLAFDWSHYSMESASRTHLPDKNAETYFHEISEEAKNLGRHDIVKVVDGSLNFSRKRQNREKIKALLRRAEVTS